LDRLEDLGHGVTLAAALPPSARRVAVIGAGWAGLAAAVTLVQRGARATVFESSRHLGGRARRVTVGGLDLDNGQHILIGAYGETLRLLRAVGVDPAEAFLRLPLELRSTFGFWMRAAPLPAPLHLVAGLLGATGITLAERLAGIRLIASHRRRGYRLDEDASVSEWLERNRQSSRIREALWQPLCTAALNTPVRLASARVFLSVLRDTIEGGRGASDLLLPRVDLTNLFPQPAARLVEARGGELRVGAAVRSIARTPAGLSLDGGDERFTRVIIACAPQHAAAVLSSISGLETLGRRLAQLESEPIYTCYLQYPGAAALPFPMLGFHRGLAQWVFDRGALSGHRGLIACVLSGSGAHESLPQEELAKALHAELAHAVPGLATPEWSRVIAEKRATFSCRPALERPGNATPIPDVFLAGDYKHPKYPATLESTVRSCVAAAGLALAGP